MMFLNPQNAAVPMKRVYRLDEGLGRNPKQLRQIQALSLDASRPFMGLSARLGLYGSPAWWANLESGAIRQELISGEIIRVDAGDEDDPLNCSVSLSTRHEEIDYINLPVLDPADAALFQIGHLVDAFCCYTELKGHPGKDGSIPVLLEVVEIAVSLDPVARHRADLAAPAARELPVLAWSAESMASLMSLDQAVVPMKRVFHLSAHHRRYPDVVKARQALTLDESRPTEGLCGKRGLYGSNEWWHYLQRGKIHLSRASGVISRVYSAPVEDGEKPVLLFDMAELSAWCVGMPVLVNDEADLALFRIGSRVDFIVLHLAGKVRPPADADFPWPPEVLEMAVSLDPPGPLISCNSPPK